MQPNVFFMPGSNAQTLRRQLHKIKKLDEVAFSATHKYYLTNVQIDQQFISEIYNFNFLWLKALHTLTLKKMSELT